LAIEIPELLAGLGDAKELKDAAKVLYKVIFEACE
jgi:hypothetical protein